MQLNQIRRTPESHAPQISERRGGLPSRFGSELSFESRKAMERTHLASVPFRDYMPKRAMADMLTEALAGSQWERRQAGRALHDEVGPLLTAAGLRLQLLRMDFPEAAGHLNEVMQTLDDAMEQVRALSQRLSPSPVHRIGLKNALEQLVDSHREKFSGKFLFGFTSPVRPPIDSAVAIYDLAAAAIGDAIEHAEASRIEISVRGAKRLSVRVKDNGHTHGAGKDLILAARVARHANVTLEVAAGKGTIVWIHHDLRRSSGG
jgi:signal transduction histidine kinase